MLRQGLVPGHPPPPPRPNLVPETITVRKRELTRVKIANFPAKFYYFPAKTYYFPAKTLWLCLGGTLYYLNDHAQFTFFVLYIVYVCPSWSGNQGFYIFCEKSLEWKFRQSISLNYNMLQQLPLMIGNLQQY